MCLSRGGRYIRYIEVDLFLHLVPENILLDLFENILGTNMCMYIY